MSIQFYSTEKREVLPFKPKKFFKADVYSCGPTVYSTPHIGNYKSMVTWDFLVRFLRFRGYEVNHVMNITDVGHLTDDEVLTSTGEDKMEKAAKKENLTVWDVARKYEEEFFHYGEMLHIARPNTVCRATEHIEYMIAMTEKLIEQRHAYVTDSGVYFDISSFPDYGRLSGNRLDTLEAGASGRVEDLGDKRSPHDFALWITNKEQAMMWDSPWGKGFPGWHVECSAMSQHYLGEEIDIHTGGTDNIFPHHECEIAQSEGATHHKPFVRYWMHTGLMTVEGEKMAKSKGNDWKVADIIAKGFSPRVLRYTFLKSHYRTSADISVKSFEESKKNLESIERLLGRLESVTEEGSISREFSNVLNAFLQSFIASLEDDLGSPQALSYLFELITDLNGRLDNGTLNVVEAKAVVDLIRTIDQSFQCLMPWERNEIPHEITLLAEQRLKAKQAKNFELADKLRGQIMEEGYKIEDTAEGFIVHKS